MSEIPQGRTRRAAKVAGLPLAYAGRTVVGAGRRLAGAAPDAVTEQIQRRTAEQLFSVLGQLKGGAQKVGQAMSIMEAALPEEIAGPYREALVRLQDQAPAMPFALVDDALVEALGADWRERLELDEQPAAAASIGQVHHGRWHDGREVAVKVQYPRAAEALDADLRTLGLLARSLSPLAPGIDMGAFLRELRERMAEETDYGREARAQQQAADGFRGDEYVHVPDVVHASPRVLVTEWVDGRPLSDIIARGDGQDRDAAAALYLDFLLAGPARAGVLHADPHPGNFRITADGRLAVLDFGAVAWLPDGLPDAMATLLGAFLAEPRDDRRVIEGLRAEGFLHPTREIDERLVLDFLEPYVEPLRADEFTFDRDWLRSLGARAASRRWQGAVRSFDLPPRYLLIHRVWMGGIGVLCQLGGTVEGRDIVAHWLGGLTDAD